MVKRSTFGKRYRQPTKVRSKFPISNWNLSEVLEDGTKVYTGYRFGTLHRLEIPATQPAKPKGEAKCLEEQPQQRTQKTRQ